MNVYQCIKHGWSNVQKACPICSGEYAAGHPCGISRTFPPGAGVYHGPEMLLVKKDEYDKLGAVIDLKHRFAYRMAEMLRSLEWSDGHWSVNYDGGGCPSCGNAHKQGHAPDCELSALLKEWDAS